MELSFESFALLSAVLFVHQKVVTFVNVPRGQIPIILCNLYRGALLSYRLAGTMVVLCNSNTYNIHFYVYK